MDSIAAKLHRIVKLFGARAFTAFVFLGKVLAVYLLLICYLSRSASLQEVNI